MIKFGIAISLVLLGCSSTPPISERSAVVDVNAKKELKMASQHLQRPISLQSDPLLLDVRPFFDFNMGHFVKARHLDAKGVFESMRLGQDSQKDWQQRFFLKVALLGGQPNEPIVVIGRGPQGEGEEGLVAWALLHVGFTQVQMSAYGGVKLKTTTQVFEAGPVSETIAKVKTKRRLWVSNLDFEKRLSQGDLQNIVVLDVRDPKLYLGGPALFKNKSANLKVVNIEWRDFINSSGQIQLQLKNKLQGIGVYPKNRIFVVSDLQGPAGVAVTALLGLGYLDVALVL